MKAEEVLKQTREELRPGVIGWGTVVVVEAMERYAQAAVWESRKVYNEFPNTPYNRLRSVINNWFNDFKSKK